MEDCSKLYSFKFRLAGIYTQEIKKSKYFPDRDLIISKAHQSRDFLSNMVLNKVLPIEITGQEKYGRLLGKIYIEGGTNVCINDIMILSGHAKSYDGGTKEL